VTHHNQREKSFIYEYDFTIQEREYTMSTFYPTNDSHRISLLRTALESHRRDQAVVHTYLTATIGETLESQAAQLEAAVQAIAQATATHQQAVAMTEVAVEAIQAQVRYTWNTVRWQVRWQGVSPAVLPYYHLRTQRTPLPKNRVDWLALADRLLLGDADAVEAGYESAIDPVALPAARAALQTALDDLNGAKQHLHSARQTGRGVRRSSDRLIRHTIGDLRHALRDQSSTDQQQIMRTYGVRFQRTSTPIADGQEQEIVALDSRSLAPTKQTGVVGWQLQPVTETTAG